MAGHRFQQVELHFRRNHGPKPHGLIRLHHPPQHVARIVGEWFPRLVEGLADHLTRVRLPGSGRIGRPYRTQKKVTIVGVVGLHGSRVTTGDGLEEDRFRQVGRVLFGIAGSAQGLAAGHAVHVRQQQFQFVRHFRWLAHPLSPQSTSQAIVRGARKASPKPANSLADAASSVKCRSGCVATRSGWR